MQYATWMQSAQQIFQEAMNAGAPVLFAVVAAISGMLFLLNRIRGLGWTYEGGAVTLYRCYVTSNCVYLHGGRSNCWSAPGDTGV